MIGSTLRDCISHDPSVWVICQALDSIYDIFGDDRCPPSLCVSLSLLSALRQLATVIKEKVSGRCTILLVHVYSTV